MCGLIAVSSAPGARYPMERVLESIRHRGPDDQGIHSSSGGDCHLGHVRLSILDLTPAGHQPMRDSSGRYFIVYNGEIYNFRELRQGLESAHGPISWRSQSDTEVIITGFSLEGPEFLGRLNGIFAIAIYDSQNRELHVLRDPLGIKPLFWASTTGGVAFCSEMKGLLALPGMRKKIRLMSVAEQLSFMYVPEPNTLYEGVLKVKPGTLMTFREGRQVTARPLFGYLQEGLPARSDVEWQESFSSTFSAAVRRQLISDAPVSIMLSGGLDSSAVAWEAVHGGATFRNAYTIAVSSQDMRHDQQSDDLAFARRMASELGLDLQVIEAERNLLEMLPALSPFLEDGIADAAAINTYVICRAARENGIKVMLTGQGADEYLGGYRRYAAHGMLSRAGWLRKAALSMACAVVPRRMPGRLNATVRRVNRIRSLLERDPRQRILGLYTWAQQSTVASLFARPIDAEIGAGLIDLYHDNIHLGEVEALMRVDHRYDLMSLNLAYCDRMSMAAGVEARVPFLDFELVQLMNSVPAHLKIKGSEGKFLLKSAMEGRLPREIIYREKAGFGLPLRSWLRTESALVARSLEPARLQREGIFNPDAVKALCEAQYSGSADNANVVFSLLCFQLWLESAGGAVH